MSKMIRKSFATETKALDETRSLIVTISTMSPDRMGDVVMPKGAELDNYLKNPVVLFGHNYGAPAVAKADELHVTDTGIMAKVSFPEPGISQLADELYGLYKGGFMNAWSIGFQANQKDAESLPEGGYQFNKWELLEFSAVPVPANAEALTVMRSKGIDPEEETEATEETEETTTEETTEEANEETTEETVEPTVSEVTVAEDGQTVSLAFTDGTTKTYAYAAKSEPQPQGIPMTVETLKLVDQLVGRALRDYKAQQTEARR